ncbi:MAG: tRNA glutamyl-Q(34) synthetase GluQRS [Paracoccaceae bacterium]
MTFITRFAPSPTGPLHLGHAYSALLAYGAARKKCGQFLLRIEDIDQSRARPKWEVQIYDDLTWLGLNWPQPVMRQSDRLSVYNFALNRLWERGLLYPCTCNRRDIAAALAAPQEGDTHPLGPDGVIYPGTCRPNAVPKGSLPENAVLRLSMTKAIKSLPDQKNLSFHETGASPANQSGTIQITPHDLIQNVGDIVLARRNMGTSYHLSVVLDDAAQNITNVIRGEDLFEATKIHILLQKLLNLPTPTYHHHKLIRDETGKRLAKRDDARALQKFRADGASPQDIRKLLGLPSSL